MGKKAWKAYVVWILLPELAGALSGWLSRAGMEQCARELIRPPLAAPGPVFPVVWVLLFALMGIGAARVRLASPSPARTRGLALFWIQLAFNFCWSLIFFNWQAFGFALAWLAVLWVLIAGMILLFRQADRTAALLQIPYLLWVTFAAYLNFGVWMLN